MKTKNIVCHKTIEGFCNAGDVINAKEFKELYPFINIDNAAYFSYVYEAKFKEGDYVVYTGPNPKFEKNKVYKINKVINNSKYIKYEICLYTIGKEKEIAEEQNLTSAVPFYIVSFYSGYEPAVHMINYDTYLQKFINSAKNMFCFKTKEEAEYVAKKFKNLSSDTLYDICMSCVKEK